MIGKEILKVQVIFVSIIAPWAKVVATMETVAAVSLMSERLAVALLVATMIECLMLMLTIPCLAAELDPQYH